MSNDNRLPESLVSYLMAHACVSARDEDATRQVLRDAALNLPQSESHKVASLLSTTISGPGRLWLSRLAG